MTQANTNSTHPTDSRIKDGLETVRGSASHATARATETLDANPLGMLVGGLAVGALAGALIPRSDREKELLAPVGAKLGATAVAAIAAAREAGRSELEQRGLTKDQAMDQAKSVVQGVAKAASGAATAAVSTAKDEATGAVRGGTPDSTGGTGDSVPPADPHRQVMAADGDVSGFNSGI
jgi:hypothetical protein